MGDLSLFGFTVLSQKGDTQSTCHEQKSRRLGNGARIVVRAIGWTIMVVIVAVSIKLLIVTAVAIFIVSVFITRTIREIEAVDFGQREGQRDDEDNGRKNPLKGGSFLPLINFHCPMPFHGTCAMSISRDHKEQVICLESKVGS